MALPLTPEDWQLLFQASAQIRLRNCPSDLLQEFLVRRLAQPAPQLAARLAQWDVQQMEALCQALRQQHASLSY